MDVGEIRAQTREEGRDETPVKSIMVTFAITAAIRAELALKKQFALY